MTIPTAPAIAIPHSATIALRRYPPSEGTRCNNGILITTLVRLDSATPITPVSAGTSP